MLQASPYGSFKAGDMTTWFAQRLTQDTRTTQWLAAASPWRLPAGTAIGSLLVWTLWDLAGLDGSALLWQVALAALIFWAGVRHASLDAQRACQLQLRTLAEASHDLRQPVHAMALYLGELSQQPLSPSGRRALDDARACAGDLHEMFHNLLGLSALQADSCVPCTSVFSLDRLLARTEHAFAPLARARNVQLSVRPGGYRVHSDPVMVERILMNFTSNALRHAHGGRVLVACRARGNTLRLAVYDNGCGIPLAQQQAVFSPFCKLAPAVAGEPGGFGLGLAIVARLARTLRAPVVLRSTPGRGSMFAIDLPLVRAHP